VEGGGGGLTVSGVSRNRGGFVKCVAIQKRLGIPGVEDAEQVNVKADGIRRFKIGFPKPRHAVIFTGPSMG
jgi:hypothetical protein